MNKSEVYPDTIGVTKDGDLTLGGITLSELAKKYETPLYIIDEKTFRRKVQNYTSCIKENYNNYLILYAAKAFAAAAIFRIADNTALGLDIVSGGELYLAEKCNFPKNKIYFHGNNKSKEEIDYVIKNDAAKIICDNFHELDLIQKSASDHKKKVDILIRLTPGIECHTHDYIKTGHLDSKFGFDIEYLDEILKIIKQHEDKISLKGFHSHIGSQIFELKPYSDSIDILLDQYKYAKEKYGFILDEINIGGGLGISYISSDDPVDIEDLAKAVTSKLKDKCNKLNLKLPKLICEPGRSIIGTSGITIYTAGSIKQVPNGRKYVSVDGGMADNPRPITYQAKYTALVANKMNQPEKETVTIAGRYCETGDILIQDISLPRISPGDIIAMFGTGAYNYSMSSNYNTIPRPACIIVNEGVAEVIIERENYKDITSKHLIPKRLS